MIEVELPDGRIAEFPDGTSEDVGSYFFEIHRNLMEADHAN